MFFFKEHLYRPAPFWQREAIVLFETNLGSAIDVEISSLRKLFLRLAGYKASKKLSPYNNWNEKAPAIEDTLPQWLHDQHQYAVLAVLVLAFLEALVGIF